MFSTAKKLIVNKIEDLTNLLEALETSNDKVFTEIAIKSTKKEIDDLQRTIMSLKLMENKKIKEKNDALRRKALRRNDIIKIKTITKEGKTYAIVPIEILPDEIEF